MEQPKMISLEELAGELEGPEGQRPAEFWNVLTDEYFTGELIPSSRRVPLDRIGAETSDLPSDTEIVVYCKGPTCPTSRAAAQKLAKLGFTNVRMFEGGLEEWKAAGRAVDVLDPAAV